jgi:hypothetical protein
MKQLNQTTRITIEQIRIGYQNIHGLAHKQEDIAKAFSQCGLDILILAETHLRSCDSRKIKNAIIDLRISAPDNIHKGGTEGVIVLCSKRIKKHINILEIDTANRWLLLRVFDIYIGTGYFPPSNDLGHLEAFMKRMIEISDEETLPLLIVADTNAKSKVFNDKVNTPRGRLLEELIYESKLIYRPPDIGRFTTRCNPGEGVPDQLFVTEDHEHLIRYHEIIHNSGIQSDHLMLKFALTVNKQVEFVKEFERINIKQLRDDEIAKEYEDSLDKSLQSKLNMLNAIKFEINNAKNSEDSISYAYKQELVDRANDLVVDWIRSSVDGICGRVSYNEKLNKSFMDEALKEKKAAVDLSYSLAIAKHHISKYVRDKRWKNYYAKAKAYNKLALGKRTEIFQDTCDQLAKDNCSMLKFGKQLNSRSRRGNVYALDTAKIESYNKHFASTYGGTPTAANDQIDLVYLQRTDPLTNRPITEAPTDRTAGVIAQLIQWLPNNKASGKDEMYAELFKRAPAATSAALNSLFNIVETLQVVPTKWKEVLVCPVWKSKGSAADIKNYRPISLTSIIRRIYERVLAPDLNTKMDPFICKNQAGFRQNRSCYDQTTILNELLLKYPSYKHCFLDLRAAYDLVDRHCLWSLIGKYNTVSDHEMIMLRGLFDYNTSRLVINGKQSEPLLHTRGCLQGSSLSPTLFNHFINSLILLLNESEKVSVCGVSLNNLFFADDCYLIAKNARTMKELLLVCERWSINVGMEFAPQKCVVLKEEDEIIEERNILKLYNTPLAAEVDFKYLGLWFNSKGCHWERIVKEKTDKARQLTNFFRTKGMSINGWRPASSVAVYKGFIRPLLEYGLGTFILPAPLLNKLQLLQNYALRCMMGTARATSTGALHRLTNVETMKCRNTILNARYFRKVHNLAIGETKKEFLASSIYRNKMLGVSNPQDKLSCFAAIKKNEFWISLGAALDVKVKIKAAAIKKYKMDSLINLFKEVNDVSYNINYNGFTNRILYPIAEVPRTVVKNVLHWRLGRVAFHQQCIRCGLQCSRAHVCDCASINEDLLAAMNFIADCPPQQTFNTLDHAIRNLDLSVDEDKKLNPDHFNLLHVINEAIVTIKLRCLGYRRNTETLQSSLISPEEIVRANNVAANSEEEEEFTVARERNGGATAIRQDARVTEGRRIIALMRNRPNGRPPSAPRAQHDPG